MDDVEKAAIFHKDVTVSRKPRQLLEATKIGSHVHHTLIWFGQAWLISDLLSNTAIGCRVS